MKLKNSRKGQGGVLEATFTIVVLAVAILVGSMMIGKLEESTIGGCTTNYTTTSNSTTIYGNSTHGLTLSNILTTYDGNLTVTYENGSSTAGNVSINGNFLGNVDGTSPDTFDVPASYLSVNTNVTYGGIPGNNTNVTKSNLTYYSLLSCDYSYDSYVAMSNTTDLTFTSLSIAPIVLLIFAAITVIGAVLMLRR